MKMRKKISWLLSFFMVFSLFMGSAGMIVKADGQKAVVRQSNPLMDFFLTFFLLPFLSFYYMNIRFSHLF